MVERVLTNENSDADTIAAAPKLMECIIQNCTGRVDHCIGPYIALALRALQEADRNSLQVGSVLGHTFWASTCLQRLHITPLALRHVVSLFLSRPSHCCSEHVLCLSATLLECRT